MVRSYSLFENLNYAKSVLRKKGLDDKNPEFLQIRELCKDKQGYLGVITKLHFNDNIQLEELSDILKTLSRLNINVQDILNMDYIQLSDYLLDKESVNADNGYKFQFSDGVYDYYRVMTYEGILNIGSPAWCIKTKSNWDAYTSNNPTKNQQWVIVKKINKKLLTPATNYLDKYTNNSNPMIRIGITFNKDRNKIYCHDDNDGTVDTDSGKGQEIKNNIFKFIRDGKMESFSFEKLLGKDPIITFDKNKKLFLMSKPTKKKEQSPDVAKINDFMGFDINWRLDGVSNYLLVVDNRFDKYIILDGYYITFCDGKDKITNPPTNQKVFFEIVKYNFEKSKKEEKGTIFLPSNLVPVYLKLGLKPKEEFLKNNPSSAFIKSASGSEYFVNVFKNRNDKFSINLVDMDVEEKGNLRNFFIFYKGLNPKFLYSDIEGFTDGNFKDYKMNPENKKFIKEEIGDEFLAQCFKLFKDSQEQAKREREEKNPSTWNKIKKWMW